ncbi:G1 family glutamic endopeptidase [Paracraurococcus ruber]|nr:G1 family glutamic endopeptidase [Paracraurococcus ruber]
MRNDDLDRTVMVNDQRITTYAPPSSDFDPLTATAEELNRFGLLSRPSPELEPRAYARWRSFYSPPTKFAEAKIGIRLERRALPSPRQLVTRSLVSRRVLTSRVLNSFNWAGGMVPSRRGLRFTRVSATWRAPLIEPGTYTERPALGWQCSAWIGLDGFHGWSRSLPQMGTVHHLKTNAPSTDATSACFIQWWLREWTSQEIRLDVPSVSGGDTVTCHMEVLDPHNVRCAFKNEATGITATVDMEASLVPGKPPITVEGATAEWIGEQPEEPLLRVPWPTPDFGSVRFSQCSTTLSGPPGSGVRSDLAPVSPRLLRFFNRRMSPRRTARVAVGHVTQPGPLEPPDPQISVTYVLKD